MSVVYCQCLDCATAAAIGDWQNVETAKMFEYHEKPYVETPRWHPMRWIGYTIRRRLCHESEGAWWEYARPRTAARRELEKLYGKNDQIGS